MNMQGPPCRGPNIVTESAARIHIAKIAVRPFITRLRTLRYPYPFRHRQIMLAAQNATKAP